MLYVCSDYLEFICFYFHRQTHGGVKLIEDTLKPLELEALIRLQLYFLILCVCLNSLELFTKKHCTILRLSATIHYSVINLLLIAGL